MIEDKTVLTLHERFKGDFHVNVTSYNGIVLLTGEVPAEGAKADVEQIVRSTPQVRAVQDELVVADAAPQAVEQRQVDVDVTTVDPAVISTAHAAARTVCSSHARPMNCRLVGSPRGPNPFGTATAGSPAPLPDLATDTGQSNEDATEWSFTLKDGPKWQDGKPVTCEDLKYGMSRTFATDVITGGPNYIIGYHGLDGAPGFGASTAWQDFDFFTFPAASKLGAFTFFPSQYVNLPTWTTIGRSEYHSLQLSMRKRASHGVSYALNYTLSKSLDHSSTPERQETDGFFTGGYTGFTINAWQPNLEYSFSDFDMRHQFNGYMTWDLPVGRGRHFGSNMHSFVNAIVS